MAVVKIVWQSVLQHYYADYCATFDEQSKKKLYFSCGVKVDAPVHIIWMHLSLLDAIYSLLQSSAALGEGVPSTKRAFNSAASLTTAIKKTLDEALLSVGPSVGIISYCSIENFDCSWKSFDSYKAFLRTMLLNDKCVSIHDGIFADLFSIGDSMSRTIEAAVLHAIFTK